MEEKTDFLRAEDLRFFGVETSEDIA